jgi:hypothetical protein
MSALPSTEQITHFSRVAIIALLIGLAIVGAPLVALGLEPLAAAAAPLGLAWIIYCLSRTTAKTATGYSKNGSQVWARLTYLGLVPLALSFWH